MICVKYSQEALEEMAMQVDLLEYASRTQDFVKHSGNIHYCICPFHNEKTPSLAINSDENFYYCFGCGRFGNVYTWIQSIEHLTFDQAVEKVADLTGSDVHSYMESESVSFYKLLKRVSEPKKSVVLDRPILDIEKDYNQRFKSEIPQEWVDEGISQDVMRKCNIRIDPMSNRIVYPVYSDDDKLIGVKGRTRFQNYKSLGIMKYMNYHRVGILNYFQGMQQARESIKETNEIIILEGIKSVMKLDGWGFHNAVSAETSTLNDYQIEILVRMHIKNVVIAFDQDVLMKKIRECTELLKKFTNVYVVYDKWRLLKEKRFI